MCYLPGDGNDARVVFYRVRKARKQHNCCECGGPIVAGTFYEEVTGIWDDGPDRFRAHLECVALWDFCIKELCGDEGGRTFGGLAEEIGEYAYRDQVEAERAECGTDLWGLFQAMREGFERSAA